MFSFFSDIIYNIDPSSVSFSLIPFYFNDPVDPSLSSFLYDWLGCPLYTIALLSSDSTGTGLIIVNPSYLFAGLIACISIYSVFKLLGSFVNNL